MRKVLRRLVRPWVVTLAVTGIYLCIFLWMAGGDPLVLVRIGTRFSEQDPDGGKGYDGQFYYYIGKDPWQGWRHMDVPAYRYQRILYPLLVRLVSLGQERLLPWAMLAINLVSIGGSVAIVEALLIECGVSRWYALSLGLFGGMLFCAITSLAEPLALCLALAAMFTFSRRRLLLSACLFALAVLTKETMLLLAGGYVVYQFTQKQFKQGLVMGSVAAVPFAIWQLCLFGWFGSFGVGAGGAGATSFYLIPFGALFSLFRYGWLVFLVFALIMVPIIVVPTVWAIWVTGRAMLQRDLHPWTFSLALFALVIPFLPESTFLDLAAMPRFASPLVALVVLYAAHSRSYPALGASLLWITTMILVPFSLRRIG